MNKIYWTICGDKTINLNHVLYFKIEGQIKGLKTDDKDDKFTLYAHFSTKQYGIPLTTGTHSHCISYRNQIIDNHADANVTAQVLEE